MDEYKQLMLNAPPHDSDEFVQFLRDNNTVRLETPEWIVVENFKYHTKEREWLTAFDLKPNMTLESKILLLEIEYPNHTFIQHSLRTRTVTRRHLHLIKDSDYENTIRRPGGSSIIGAHLGDIQTERTGSKETQ